MKIETVSVQGSNELNEDALIINHDLSIYGVADGATSLVPYRSKNNETGGRLASQIVKTHFEKMKKPNNQSLETLLIEANNVLGKKMQSEGIDTDLKDNVWTTGAAIVRLRQHQIEYVQAGDCMIVALYEDKSYRLITRDQIAYFDNISKEKWVEAINEGYTSRKEIRSKVEPFIRKHKSKINMIDGYCVLDGSKEASLFLESGKINRIGLEGLIIFSDGLFMHDEINSISKIDPIEFLVQQISIVGIKGYINYLNALEENDPECLRFPRTKKSDDKTAIYIKF